MDWNQFPWPCLCEHNPAQDYGPYLAALLGALAGLAAAFSPRLASALTWLAGLLGRKKPDAEKKDQ